MTFKLKNKNLEIHKKKIKKFKFETDKKWKKKFLLISQKLKI